MCFTVFLCKEDVIAVCWLYQCQYLKILNTIRDVSFYLKRLKGDLDTAKILS